MARPKCIIKYILYVIYYMFFEQVAHTFNLCFSMYKLLTRSLPNRCKLTLSQILLYLLIGINYVEFEAPINFIAIISYSCQVMMT